MKQKFITSRFRQNCQYTLLYSGTSKISPKVSALNQYFVFFFSDKKRKFQKRIIFSQSMDQNQTGAEHSIFFNFSFDKGRLKSIVSWFLEKYGQYKTLQLLEKLKEFGFGYATLGGISLGIDDLKVPNQKVWLLHEAETKVSKDLLDYRNAKISGIERMQRLIYIWNQTNETLKQEVVKYFETTDLFNPIYMMAFSGARGNMSQVRQLVGMRGLMSDPQGQIIDFPIQSNFREGLTLTEYLISTYGARKGIVDTALRTATAGYLTRRLVDVAQHVIVSQFDCGTNRGIFLFDMKEANKTIYSFQNRLIGRVLANDISTNKFVETSTEFSTNEKKQLLFPRNIEIDSKCANVLAKITKKAFVRSPLTCETQKFVCQLCYGWSLSSGKLVSIGEAVGVIAAQSIGEPGTQLTMRTFHTGGVFAGGITDQILSPFQGQIEFFHSIPGTCIRTSLSSIAFLTKAPGSFFVKKKKEEKFPMIFNSSETDEHFSNIQKLWKLQNKNTNFSEIYKIPSYAILFVRNGEFVEKKQLLAQFSTLSQKQVQYGTAEQTFYSTLAGEFILGGLSKFVLPPSLKSRNKTNFLYLKKKEENQKYSSSEFFDQKKKTKFFPTFSVTKEIENETSFLYSEENHHENTNENQEEKIELIIEKKSDSGDLSDMEQKYDLLWKSKNWTNIWILSGHIFSNSIEIQTYLKQGDFIKTTSVLNRILWKKQNKFQIFSISCPVPFVNKKFDHKNRKKMVYLKASEKFQNVNPFFSSFLYSFDSLAFLPVEQIKKAFSFSFQKKEKNSFYNPKTRFKQAEKTLQKNTLNLKSKDGKKKYQYKQSIEIHRSLKFFKRTGPTFLKQVKFSNKTFNRSKKFLKNQSGTRFSRRSAGNIFSINLQNFFSFLQKSKKTKLKNQNKQLFYKFSTLNKNSFYLNSYLYSKIQNKTKKTLGSKQLLQLVQKNYFSLGVPFFVSFKQNRKNLFENLKVDQKRNQFSFEKLTKHFVCKFFSKNSQFLLHNCAKVVKYQQIVPAFFHKKKRIFLKTKNFTRNFVFSKQNMLNSAEQSSSTLFFKKPLFQFQFDKLRYNNVGYNSTFSIYSKNNVSSFDQKNSFSLFLSLNQFFSQSRKTVNPGKNEIHFGNASFVGKDFPTFLGYCLPYDSQTLTNGIFMIKSFENFSKKNSQMKILCVEKNYLQTFSFNFFESKIQNKNNFYGFPNGTKYFQNITPEKRKNLFFQTTSNIPSIVFPSSCFAFKNQKEIKKKRGNFKKKMYFIKIATFDFFKFLNLKINPLIEKPKSLKTISSEFIPFSNQLYFALPVSKNKNLFNAMEKKQKISLDSFINFQKQKFEKSTKNTYFQSFSYLYHFQNSKPIFEKTSQRNYFEFSDSPQIKDSSNKFGQTFGIQFHKGDFSKKFSLFLKRRFLFKNQKSIQIRDFYSDELFWLPQENYLISTSFFENKRKKNQLKPSNSCSNIYKQKQPLFFITNKQGKKKPVFSKLQGISNWYSLSIQNISFPFMKRKTNHQKFDFCQQKFSFFSDHSLQKESSLHSLNLFNNFQNHNSQKQSSLQMKKQQNQPKTRNSKKLFSESVRFSQYKIKKQKLVLLKAKKNQKLKSAFVLFNHRKKQKQFSVNFFKLNYCSRGFQKQKNFNQNKKPNLRKNLKKNFLYGLFKNQYSRNLWNLQKLFLDKFEKLDFSTKKSSHFKFGFAKKLSNNCLSCLPFEKKKNRPKFQLGLPKTKTSLIQMKNLQSQQMNMKIQSGWLYIFSNPISLLKSHQHMFNIGHLWKSSVGFEQHKLFVEIVVFNLSSLYKKAQVLDESFSVTKFVKNKNCRFSNEGANFAQEQFFLAFENIKQRRQSVENEKLIARSKQLVVFFRPFHYKIVENSMNYKKIFEAQNRRKVKPKNRNIKMTTKKTSQKRKMFSKQFDFETSLSSRDIYKNYHSDVWNVQKVFKKFLQNSIDFDFEISSEFSKQIRKTGQNSFHSSGAKISFFSKLKKTQNVYESRLQKKESLEKFSKFKLVSQKIRLNKFDSLVKRNVFERKRIKNLFFSSKKINEKKLKRGTKEKNKKQKNSIHFFFSFYPIQFLPMKLSSNIVCKNFNSFSPFSNLLTSQKTLTLFVNSLTNKIQFCLCEKKAAFFNQRFSFSNSILKFSPPSSYFLNKDGIQFHSSIDSFIFQARSFRILKTERKLNNFQTSTFLFSIHKNQVIGSLFLKTNGQKETTKSNNRMTRNKIKNEKKILFENTLFQNNPNYYANTKFLSPHQGEILSIGTNEKNWWKKASEISTIQKLDNLFTIITKTDLFVVQFPTTNKQFETMNFVELKDLKPIDIEKKKNYLVLNEKKQLKFCLQKKQNHLLSLYEFVFKTQKNSILSTNFGFDESEIQQNEFLKNSKSNEKTIFLTKYENKLYKFENLNVNYATCSKKPMLGTFFVYGDCIFQNAIRKPGQVVHLNRKEMTLRKGQPFLVSPKGILHLSNIPYIQKNVPLLTLPYQTVQSGDIVQGIPKVEQYFEARTTVQGRFFVSSLPIILKGIFERYKATLPLEQATRQSFLKVQQIVVDGVQRVYRSQGVSITDKHLEVVVRQMTTKVQILNGAQTGFFPGELVNLNFVEKVNKFLMVKIRYEPVILGITRASLEVDSFLSASSFQQTTKILSLAAISKKKDFLKGLKENLLVGNLIPSGTGYFRSSKTVQKF